MSQHEAIARLIGLSLKETNTPVLFVPTGFRNQRTRLLKPPALLKHMSKDPVIPLQNHPYLKKRIQTFNLKTTLQGNLLE